MKFKKGYMGGFPIIIGNKSYEERLEYVLESFGKEGLSAESILNMAEEYVDILNIYEPTKAAELSLAIKKYRDLGREDKTIANES